jgi:hypothetical protein
MRYLLITCALALALCRNLLAPYLAFPLLGCRGIRRDTCQSCRHLWATHALSWGTCVSWPNRASQSGLVSSLVRLESLSPGQERGSTSAITKQFPSLLIHWPCATPDSHSFKQKTKSRIRSANSAGGDGRLRHTAHDTTFAPLPLHPRICCSNRFFSFFAAKPRGSRSIATHSPSTPFCSTRSSLTEP